MQIIIQGHKVEITAPLRSYAAKKIGKIEQFFVNLQKAEIILDARSNRDTKKSQVAEVSIWAAGKKVLRATAVGQDMYAAIDLVFEKLEEQIKKHKAKRVKEQRRKAEKIKEMLHQAPLPAAEKKPVLVCLTRPVGKPLHEEEAKLELSSSREDFHFYRDAKTHQIHVICKKGDQAFEVFTPRSTGLAALSAEEAYSTLEREEKLYLPFVNSSSGEINILYRRKSGNYGLIEPRL